MIKLINFLVRVSVFGMSRRSRRKTLSHAEIESFLLDLGEEQEQGNDREKEGEVGRECVREEEERKERARVVREFYKVSVCVSV